jgi:SAM-dependent methyltransferase
VRPLVEDLSTSFLLAEQVAYYRARAPEYDAWWLREGHFDLGEVFNEAWQREVERLYAALEAFGPTGDVLEMAAGTGVWTERLSRYAESVTALDASPETLAINRHRLSTSPTPMRYLEADIFSWEPDRRYDVVCFSFWLTHVPLSCFGDFWDRVDRALSPDGRVFFVDNALPVEELPHAGRYFARHGPLVEGVDSITDIEAGVSIRRLSDGREFRIVKRHWAPDALQHHLADLGWEIQIGTTEWAFIYGQGERSGARPLG